MTFVITIRFTEGEYSVWYDTESVSDLRPKIYNLVPNETKQSKTLNAFTFRIKSLVPERCSYRICKVYLYSPLRNCKWGQQRCRQFFSIFFAWEWVYLKSNSYTSRLKSRRFSQIDPPPFLLLGKRLSEVCICIKNQFSMNSS